MWHPGHRLARPLYEVLPGLYVLCGVAALAASYRASSPLASVALGLPGLAALLAGSVVWLRRRNYRRMRASYQRPDALSGAGRDGNK
jgi:nitrate reductase gamma subunit